MHSLDKAKISSIAEKKEHWEGGEAQVTGRLDRTGSAPYNYQTNG